MPIPGLEACWSHAREQTMKHVGRTQVICMALLLGASATAGAAIEWPQAVDAPEGTIIVYQPQPEELNGNLLSGRAAIALEVKGKDEPIFGVMWFEAKIDTDREQDIALVPDEPLPVAHGHTRIFRRQRSLKTRTPDARTKMIRK